MAMSFYINSFAYGENMNCIYCETSLPERAFYCKSCKKQVKCKNCKELLEQNSQACVMCGTNVGEGEINSNGSNNQSQTMNTFEFKETEKEKSLKAFLTDESVKNLSDTLTGAVTGNNLLSIGRKYDVPQLNGVNDFIENQNDFETNDGKTIEIKAKPVSVNEGEFSENLKSIFYKDENKFILEVQDLKASKQLDFGKRIVYLQLLYSKEVLGEDFVSRETLNETLLEVMKLRDSNVISWMTNATDLFRKTEQDKEFFRLKSDGQTKAIEVLSEVLDSNKKGTFFPEKKSKAGSKNSNTSNKLTSSKKKGSAKSKDVEDWISKWQSLDLGIDVHGIAKDLSVLDRVVLALWVIQKVTDGKTTSSTTYKLEPLFKDLLFVSGNRGNLDKVLKNGYPHNIQKTPDGWRITPTGITHAEKLIGIPEIISKPKTKK